MELNKNLNICVVCGGISSEREISLKSGRAVKQALADIGYTKVKLFDLKRENVSELLEMNPDIVYLALHGKGGEDGCIQGMLELLGIPYTGPGVASSALCMNKILTKNVLSALNIPTAKYICLDKQEYVKNKQDTIDKIINYIGEKVVVKAPSEGSSIGVVLTESENEILQALNEVFQYDNIILIEERLKGIEVTLPIIGNSNSPLVLPIVEIDTDNKFYDFEAKYTTGQSRHIIPARLDRDMCLKVEELGIQTYRGLGCNGISRIDLIIDEHKGPMIIEVNTLPGMTETSLVPDAAKAMGIKMGELCEKIMLAIKA